MKQKVNVRKMILCAIFASLAFVLNTFVYFPAMAPFQHFVDVVAAVFLGPWWACLSAFLCGLMRMMSGRTIQAVTGAAFGPILGGMLWRKTKNIYLVCVGEIIGTGIIGAIMSYPVMTFFWGKEGLSWLFYVPSFICGTLKAKIHSVDAGARIVYIDAIAAQSTLLAPLLHNKIALVTTGTVCALFKSALQTHIVADFLGGAAVADFRA